MIKLKSAFLTLLVAVGLGGGLSVVLPSLALAADTPSQIITTQACKTNPSALGCRANDKVFGAGSIFNNGIAVLIGLIASVSVVMVVVGGLRYVLSGGDSAGIKSAKDTILYALIGLGVALVAFLIVGFVIGRIG